MIGLKTLLLLAFVTQLAVLTVESAPIGLRPNRHLSEEMFAENDVTKPFPEQPIRILRSTDHDVIIQISRSSINDLLNENLESKSTLKGPEHNDEMVPRRLPRQHGLEFVLRQRKTPETDIGKSRQGVSLEEISKSLSSEEKLQIGNYKFLTLDKQASPSRFKLFNPLLSLLNPSVKKENADIKENNNKLDVTLYENDAKKRMLESRSMWKSHEFENSQNEMKTPTNPFSKDTRRYFRADRSQGIKKAVEHDQNVRDYDAEINPVEEKNDEETDRTLQPRSANAALNKILHDTKFIDNEIDSAVSSLSALNGGNVLEQRQIILTPPQTWEQVLATLNVKPRKPNLLRSRTQLFNQELVKPIDLFQPLPVSKGLRQSEPEVYAIPADHPVARAERREQALGFLERFVGALSRMDHFVSHSARQVVDMLTHHHNTDYRMAADDNYIGDVDDDDQENHRFFRSPKEPRMEKLYFLHN